MPPVNNQSGRNSSKPKLVNRTSGLLKSLKGKRDNSHRIEDDIPPNSCIDNIAAPLLPLVIYLHDLTLDPDNARMHPERNMQAIKLSLATYGQLKPIVVRKQGMIVVAGNGTVEAARQLGWTKIAANVIEMTDRAAIGFGLADNKTAELAKWDYNVVARLERLLEEQKGVMVGWSDDEIEVLRAADWTPPAISDDDFTVHKEEVILKLSKCEAEVLEGIVDQLRKREKVTKKWSDGKCLAYICMEWASDEESIDLDTFLEEREEEDE